MTFFPFRDTKLMALDSFLLDGSSTVPVEILSSLTQLPHSVAKKFQASKRWSEALNFKDSSKESSPEVEIIKEGSRTPRETERKSATAAAALR